MDKIENVSMENVILMAAIIAVAMTELESALEGVALHLQKSLNTNQPLKTFGKQRAFEMLNNN